MELRFATQMRKEFTLGGKKYELLSFGRGKKRGGADLDGAHLSPERGRGEKGSENRDV